MLPSVRVPARRVITILALGIAVSACGDDGPTGPSANFDLVGEWQWRVTNATATNASCSITGVTLTFSRNTGGVLIGHRQSPGGNNINCTINGSQTSANFTTNTSIQSLSFDGTSIAYAFTTSTGTWQMTGSINNDNAMGGTATITLGTSIGTLTLTGPWTATRN